MRPLIAILACLVALMLAASGAGAQTGSEFDQYVPDLPDANHDVPLPDVSDKIEKGDHSPGGESASTGDGPSGEPSEPLANLSAKGPEGKALAEVSDATAPRSAHTSEAGGVGDVVSLAGAEGASSGSSLLDLLGGPDGGMGVAFPLVLLTTLGIGIGYALRRRRT